MTDLDLNIFDRIDQMANDEAAAMGATEDNPQSNAILDRVMDSPKYQQMRDAADAVVYKFLREKLPSWMSI